MENEWNNSVDFNFALTTKFEFQFLVTFDSGKKDSSYRVKSLFDRHGNWGWIEMTEIINEAFSKVDLKTSAEEEDLWKQIVLNNEYKLKRKSEVRQSWIYSQCRKIWRLNLWLYQPIPTDLIFLFKNRFSNHLK